MSSYTPAQIRQAGIDNAWVDSASMTALDPRAIYEAAMAYGVSAAELDVAFPEWGPPGTVAQFIAAQGWSALPSGVQYVTATAPASVVKMAPAPVYLPPTSAPAPAPVSATAIHPTYVPPIETVAMPYPYDQRTGATLPDIVTNNVQPAIEPFPVPQPARLSPAAVLLGAGAVALLLLKR